jgi:hypothetical protein
LYALVCVNAFAPKAMAAMDAAPATPAAAQRQEKDKESLCVTAECYCNRTLAQSPETVFVESPGKIEGNLSKEEVVAVVSRRLLSIKSCYDRYVREYRNLSGGLLAAFVIGKEGRVGNASIESSTLGNQPTEYCVAESIKRWRFPIPRGGEVNVQYEFQFSRKTPPKDTKKIAECKKERNQAKNKFETSRVAKQKACDLFVAKLAPHRRHVPKAEFQSLHFSGIMAGPGGGCGRGEHRSFLKFTERYATLSTLHGGGEGPLCNVIWEGDITYYRVKDLDGGFRLERVCDHPLSEEVATSLAAGETPPESLEVPLIVNRWNNTGVITLRAAGDGTYLWDRTDTKIGNEPFKLLFHPR